MGSSGEVVYIISLKVSLKCREGHLVLHICLPSEQLVSPMPNKKETPVCEPKPAFKLVLPV